MLTSAICRKISAMSLLDSLPTVCRFGRTVCLGLAAFLLMSAVPSIALQAQAQDSSEKQPTTILVEGTVRNAAGEPVGGAFVFLEDKGGARLVRTQSNAKGAFVFSLHKSGIYALRAEKDELRGVVSNTLALKPGDHQHCDVVIASIALGSSSATGTVSHSTSNSASNSGSSSATMELSDSPSFTVAGVTDWSNAGLHGSDTRARTSDTLAKETLALKPEGTFKAPTNSPNSPYDLAVEYRDKGDFARARNEAQKSLTMSDTAEGHRLLGDLNENLGDPVAAEHEFETATRMEPSEQSYLDWGTELLLHKAGQAATQVFTKGSTLHPNSSRLLAGLGAALYAAGSYDEAAQRMCTASDINPADPVPYLFLGEMEKSAPAPMPCGEDKLARFAQQQPENAVANYYYALALWKRDRTSGSQSRASEVEASLQKAVKLDPRFADAYVQMGIVHAAQGDFAFAIDAYKKAIAVNQGMADAHYQLSLAYKRTGEEAKAHEEFHAYQQAQKIQQAEIDRHRRQLRQFVIILKEPSASSTSAPVSPQP